MILFELLKLKPHACRYLHCQPLQDDQIHRCRIIWHNIPQFLLCANWDQTIPNPAGIRRTEPIQFPVFIPSLEKSGIENGYDWRTLYNDLQHRPLLFGIFSRGFGAWSGRSFFYITVYFSFHTDNRTDHAVFPI